ncbi:MAG: MBL fold metallo-hydrolase [Chthonomonadales bacterium]
MAWLLEARRPLPTITRNMEPPKITLFSTALVSTWAFDQTHRVLFDAGDGVAALLDARIHRIRYAAITHAHRDHCSGLLQLLNLRGSPGDFTVCYPEASGAARALATFLSNFDARSTGKVRWVPVAPGSMVPIEPDRHYLRPFETDHYPRMDPPRALSLGYQIVRHVDKLKPEFMGLPQQELDALRERHGRAFITHTVEDILLTITGDTLPMPPERYAGTRVLIHECTFLDARERAEMQDRGHPHSCLDEVLEIAREARVTHLGLYHLSRRYDDHHIRSRVRELCMRMRLPCPVSVALPGTLHEDLFADPVWKGMPNGS